MSDKIEHHMSCGNVFADLGLSEPEMRLNRAMLALYIKEVIAERRLTQSAAAEVMGVDQPKVSAILCGRLTGFLIERPLEFLTRLGQDVRIVVEPAPAERDAGEVVVQILAPAHPERRHEKRIVTAR